MARYKYLIVGGGLAADAAVRGIREIDQHGAILVVSDESDPPYDRPPLTKGLWRGKALDTIWRHTEALGAELRLATRIVALDRADRKATDAKGASVTFEKLLLATGGSPRRLRQPNVSIIYFRNLSDFRRVWESAIHRNRFVVIGGGFIGSEIAAALSANGLTVSLVFSANSIGDAIYPRPLANFLNVYFRKHGVDVRFGERIDRINQNGNKLVVHTRHNGPLVADTVIAGIGIEPNVSLAKTAGLDIDAGIVVDETLRTSDPYIYAAGDVANFPCSALGRRLRFEHEDNAQAMGKIAGRNMAGASEPYRHLPYFYSDFFDLSFEAVGEIDAGLNIVEDWERKFCKGVIYYLKDDNVRGVLLWNVWGLVEAARDLISSRRAMRPGDLVGRLRE